VGRRLDELGGVPRFRLYGWWTAVAQNVAPRWFHARQKRLSDERRARIVAVGTTPAFGLADWPGERSVHAAEVTWSTRRSCPLRRHRRVGPIDVHEVGAHHTTSADKHLVVTTRRRIGHEAWSDESRSMKVHQFLLTAGYRPSGTSRHRDRSSAVRRSWSARLGTTKEARKIGRKLFPVHRKATVWFSAASKV